MTPENERDLAAFAKEKKNINFCQCPAHFATTDVPATYQCGTCENYFCDEHGNKEATFRTKDNCVVELSPVCWQCIAVFVKGMEICNRR